MIGGNNAPTTTITVADIVAAAVTVAVAAIVPGAVHNDCSLVSVFFGTAASAEATAAATATSTAETTRTTAIVWSHSLNHVCGG